LKIIQKPNYILQPVLKLNSIPDEENISFPQPCSKPDVQATPAVGVLSQKAYQIIMLHFCCSLKINKNENE
jgi:hypothetical protein